ncbi:MAG: M48 family metallopeptidase [Magnetococcus sp. DMHC-8]
MLGASMDSRQGLIVLQGEEIPYLLVRMRRRKRMSLRVDGQGLQVRIPWRGGLRQAEQFMTDHAVWILQQLRQAQQAAAAQPGLQEGTRLPFLDGFLQLCFGAGQIRPLVREGEQLWVAAHHRDRSVLTGLLEEWYRQQALLHLPARLAGWSTALDAPFARLTIRSQKSRWGSCSSRKTISLNWRLMCLSTHLGDYVMVHELCHLRYMNHSPAFWAMVARFIPDHLVCRRQLRLFSSPW